MRKHRLALLTSVAVIAVAVLACQDETVAPEAVYSPQFGRTSSSDLAQYVAELAAETNARLEEEGLNVRIERAHYYTASHEAGQTIYFDDRTLQLDLHFVPGDPRRLEGDNLDIAYMVDQVQGSNLSIPVTTAAIDRGMATWDGVNCSNIPITQLSNPSFDIGVAFGGFPAVYLGADITHAGWVGLPRPILGMSIPYVWIDGGGNFTDINNDGKIDIAFWEIYYSTEYTWADDGVSNIDVESIALHEAGHGLDQGHFGKLFRTDMNGMFHFAPRAVMNAGYTGPQRVLRNADIGGHCSIWARWPHR
jgi:hypothetical protein